jgi:multicomponent K+:H+ antiporter subunit A
MAKFGRGLICMPMTEERLAELDLPQMVTQNTARFETAFCVPIEAKGVTSTGISAGDRAATVLAAIDPRTRPSDLARPADATETTHAYLEVPAVLVRLLLPIAALVSLHLFLRGHNEPGGGFVAGLVMAIAFIAQYMVGGTQWVEDRTNLRPARWMAVGLALAIVTGLGSLAVAHPFMTTHVWHFNVPVLGDIHLPSATFFDLGVFAVVVGAVLLLLTSLGHQSLRARRAPPTGAAVEGPG